MIWTLANDAVNALVLAAAHSVGGWTGLAIVAQHDRGEREWRQRVAIFGATLSIAWLAQQLFAAKGTP